MKTWIQQASPVTELIWALVSDLNLLRLFGGNPIILCKVIPVPHNSQQILSYARQRHAGADSAPPNTFGQNFPNLPEAGSPTGKRGRGRGHWCQSGERAHTPSGHSARGLLRPSKDRQPFATSPHLSTTFIQHPPCPNGRFQKLPWSTQYTCIVGLTYK